MDAPTPLASSAQPTSAASQAAIFALLHPSTYLERFLSSSLRDDARSFNAHRPTTAVVGAIKADEASLDGSCSVSIGGTTVLAGVRAEIGVPDEGREGLGWIVPNVELSAMCSSRFRPGAPSEEAQVLTERLLTILDASSYVTLADLCIEPGKAAWCLYIDVVCLSFDGNALDAALLATVGALRDARIPEATYEPDSANVMCKRTSASPLPLASHPPFACSFGIREGTHLLTDPTTFESSFLDSHSTVVLSPSPSRSRATARSTAPDPSSLELVHHWHAGPARAVLSASEDDVHDLLADASSQTHKAVGGQIVLDARALLRVCVRRAAERYGQIWRILSEAEALAKDSQGS